MATHKTMTGNSLNYDYTVSLQIYMYIACNTMILVATISIYSDTPFMEDLPTLIQKMIPMLVNIPAPWSIWDNQQWPLLYHGHYRTYIGGTYLYKAHDSGLNFREYHPKIFSDIVPPFWDPEFPRDYMATNQNTSGMDQSHLKIAHTQGETHICLGELITVDEWGI